MRENASEREWIEQAREGNDEAFARLVGSYQTPVYNLCYRMLGDSMEAEDAAQESFWKAYNALHRYDPERKFVTWMLSISSNHCIDRLRKRRIKKVSLEAMPPRLELSDSSQSPESSLVQSEREAVVQEMLDQIGETDRAAVVLRYWYELSYSEIADTLSLTVSAVKSRLHRARRDLAQNWIAEGRHSFAVKGKRNEAPTV
jgi:RNA polymerase sigma-70 factor (ECF subfamily)